LAQALSAAKVLQVIAITTNTGRDDNLSTTLVAMS
jgi:hypothetical protein